MNSERDRIRNKVHAISPNRWKADEFDVRYYLISQLKKIVDKSVLDIGGGMGIICSEMDKSNFRVLIDIEFNELRKCHEKTDPLIHPICASFTNLPFKDGYFGIIISSHIIELTKYMDKKNNQNAKDFEQKYPTAKKYLSEIIRVLINKGTAYLTTPNNAYYKSNKWNYDELKKLFKIFDDNKILFYNKYPRFSKNRKLDMTNVIPKLKSKVISPDKIINGLIREESENYFSKYFYCILKKGNKIT